MTGKRNVLIVGAGWAGEELLEGLRGHFAKKYKIVGFVDDDKKKIGKEVGGLVVLGGISKLASLIKKHRVNEVFIAIPSAEGEVIRRVIESCEQEKVVFRIVPRTLEIVQGKVKLEQIREVRIEDLLGRAIVQAEQKTFEKTFSGKTILVTGAAGSIGSELCRQLIQFSPKRLVALDRWESGVYELELEARELAENNFETVIADVREEKKMRRLMEEIKPDYVFHAAAFKHVPLMQKNAEEAIKNNIFGTKSVAEAALKAGVGKFINISTDKAANPTSIMGVTKLVGEQVVAELNKMGKTKYCSVRFGNVMGSSGSVIPMFQKQIASGGPVTVTDEKMTRYFMTIPEAVQLVLQASVMGKGGETFVLDMGEQVRIDDLARLMIRLLGYVPESEIKIEYIGRRPGEKLSEQLVTENELIEKTENKKIFKVRENSTMQLVGGLKETLGKSEEEMLRLLKRVAPELEEPAVGQMGIPLTRASLGREEREAVSQVLKSGWLTMGKETVAFEEEFTKYVGAKHAIAVNSCTSALFLALKALGIGEGDEVVVPSFTFASSVSVILHCGATPVFADICKEGYVMDQKSFEAVVTEKTKAVIPVHYGGNRAKIKTKLPIIEDSAHLIRRNGDNKKVFASCYSFYATKNMTTGEGGMVTTGEKKIADWLRKARLHGLSRDAWRRYGVKAKWRYGVEFAGYKCNPTDLASALGRVQLAKLSEFEQRRKEVVALYNELLGLDNKGTHLYPILVNSRDKFMEYMKNNGVGCSFHFTPLHLEPAFKKYARGKLAVTEEIGGKVVTLPLDAVISDSEVRKVAKLVREFGKGGKDRS